MSKFVDLVAFDQLVEHGRETGNIVEGMPWSFEFAGMQVTHETNDLYLLNGPGGTIRLSRGEKLVIFALVDND